MVEETPVGRLIISGCNGTTEKLSSFVDKITHKTSVAVLFLLNKNVLSFCLKSLVVQADLMSMERLFENRGALTMKD